MDEFETGRETGIGGSDAPGIIGVGYSTPMQVYLRKVMPECLPQPAPAERERMECGQLYEEPLAKWYARKQGWDITKTPTLRSSSVPWLMASPDYLVDGHKILLEIKHVSSWLAREWGPEGTDLIPLSVIIQAQHYLDFLKYDRCDVVANIGGNKRKYYTLHADKKLQTMIFSAEEAFWINHVVPKVPPKLTAADDITEYLKAKYPKNANTAISLTSYDKEAKLIKNYVHLRNEKKTAVEQEKHVANLIRALMGEAGEITIDDEPAVRWKKCADRSEVQWMKVVETLCESQKIKPEDRAAAVSKNTVTISGSRRFTCPLDNGDDDE